VSRPTLRRRLTTLTAAAVAVAVVGVSVAAWLLLRFEMRDDARANLESHAAVYITRLDPIRLQSPPSWVRADVSTLFGEVTPSGHGHKPVFQTTSLPVTSSDVAVALGESGPQIRDIEVNRVHYLMLTAHTVRGDAVQLANDMSGMDSTLAHFAVLLGGADIVAIVIAAALGYALTVAGLRPVYRVAGAAAHVAATQDLGAAVPISAWETAEVASVAASMNHMLTALSLSRDAQRRLVEDASHELATPLTSLRTNVDLLLRAERNPQRQLDAEDRRRLLSDIEAQMGELDHLVEEVVDLARDPGNIGETVELDLAAVVRAAVTRARTRTPEVTFTLADEPVTVSGRRSGLERAVLNLLDNAAKWSPPDEPVTVEVSCRDGSAAVVVADRGPGVPESERELVFERFRRTADSRAQPGSGLGLAIVREVVMAHGGRAWLVPRAGGGTEAHIQLPTQRISVRPSEGDATHSE